jgi:outer membrane protein assembly factor BamB
LVWAVLSDVAAAGGGPATGTGVAEFQPGPRVVDGIVVAALREYASSGDDLFEQEVPSGADEVRTSIAAFDLETGAPRWRTPLSKGVEIRRDRLRFTAPSAGASSAQPIAALGTRVFLGTNTGAGALVDALDGRVEWILAQRRRPNGERTWSGSRPDFDPATAAILWAPADSDFLYWLRGAPDLQSRGLFVHPPWAAGDAEVAVGGDPSSAVVLARLGAQRAALALDPATGARAVAPFLGPDEVFAGDGLCSQERAYFATTRGLYLLDRTRDLFVLDYAPLRPLGRPGGSVFARGERVCVLGLTTLWVFRARG